jgi:hypothetical protein
MATTKSKKVWFVLAVILSMVLALLVRYCIKQAQSHAVVTSN